MCFANAVVEAANLRDNLYIQPLIKEHGYAWMTSSKVPGGLWERASERVWPQPGSGPLCFSNSHMKRFRAFKYTRDKKGDTQMEFATNSFCAGGGGGQPRDGQVCSEAVR